MLSHRSTSTGGQPQNMDLIVDRIYPAPIGSYVPVAAQISTKMRSSDFCYGL